MKPHGDDKALFRRYIDILDVQVAAPTLDLLTQVTAAHVHRIPFENISKLLHYRRKGFAGVAALEDYLEGIARHHFGGTCYANASHFSSLLRYLGFDVRLCGADMKNPDVHLVNIVAIDGREFLVDVGYGAPFWQPLPRDLNDDVTVSFGDDRYVLRPRDANGCSRLDFYRRGKLVHGYLAKPQGRSIDFFQKQIADSFTPTAVFMNNVTVARYSAEESVTIRPNRIVRAEGGIVRETTIENRAVLYELIEEHFGISRKLSAEALEGIELESERM